MVSSTKFLTNWSLLINFSIFLWSIIYRIPKWLFLFAACFLTMTSIAGTFFITIPNINLISKVGEKTNDEVFFYDFILHVGSLIIFLLSLLFFKYNIEKESTDNIFIVLLLGFIVCMIYLYFINWENIYEVYDNREMSLICLLIFISSYFLYIKLMNNYVLSDSV